MRRKGDDPPNHESSSLSSASAASKPAPRDRVWADISLFGVAAIWGINIPVMKSALTGVDVFVFNAIRLTVSSIVLAACCGLERPKVPMRKWPWERLIIYSILAGAAYQVMFLLGIAQTTSGNTALIIATVPMWTALMAYVFLGEQLRRIAWVGLSIALIGTIIVALQKDDVSSGYFLGNLIVVAAALLWSAGTVFSRPLLKSQVVSPMQLAAVGAVLALPIHLAFGAWNLPTMPNSKLSDWWFWVVVAYSGILSSGLAQPMWNFGVRIAGSAHAAVIQNLIPVVAIIVGWAMGGEIPTSAQFQGGFLILSGLFLMRSGRN